MHVRPQVMTKTATFALSLKLCYEKDRRLHSKSGSRAHTQKTIRVPVHLLATLAGVCNTLENRDRSRGKDATKLRLEQRRCMKGVMQMREPASSC